MQSLSPKGLPPIARKKRGIILAAAVAAVLATGIGVAGLGQAQANPQAQATPQVPAQTAASDHNGQFQLADIIEKVQPAVVNVVAHQSSIQPTQLRGMDPRMEEMLRRFFGPGIPHMQGPQNEPMQSATALGSGFIIESDGYVVTNNHVIEGAERVDVVLEDGTTLSARVVGADPRSDLAVLKVDSKKPLPSVRFGDSDLARVGEWVVAIGNPFGLGGTATAGIISARGRDIQSGPYDDYLQIDAPINRGNSGGPVFDTQGRVIGINTAIFSPNGGSVGIGFAIPSSQAQPVVQQMIENGHVTRGWLGVQIQPVNDDIKSSLGLENTHGALIADVSKDSPAEKAGLEVTDVVLAFDGHPVTDSRTLVRLVGRTKPDQKVPVTVWRDGKKQTLKVKIGTLQDTEQDVVAANQPGSDTGKLGLKVAPLDDQSRDQLSLDDSVKGVLVTGVEPDSSAARQGLRPGDVILRVGPARVDSPRSLAQAVESAAKHGDESVLALVRRGDGQRFVALKLS